MNNVPEPEQFDFGDGSGLVPAHRHKNPDGSEGGWVAETASVAETAVVSKDARVYGFAQVSEGAQICDAAQVYDHAKVSGAATISARAHIYGKALVYGAGKALVYGAPHLFGEARVSGSVHGSAKVFGMARIEKTEDLQHGEGWTAFQTDCGIRLHMHPDRRVKGRGTTTLGLSSWEELPKRLHEFGLIPPLEYLARALELEQKLEQKPESAP